VEFENIIAYEFEVLRDNQGTPVVVFERGAEDSSVVDRNNKVQTWATEDLEGLETFVIELEGTSNPALSTLQMVAMQHFANAQGLALESEVFQTERVGIWRDAHNRFVEDQSLENAALLVWAANNFYADYMVNGAAIETEELQNDPEFQERKENALRMMAMSRMLDSLLSDDDDEDFPPALAAMLQ